MRHIGLLVAASLSLIACRSTSRLDVEAAPVPMASLEVEWADTGNDRLVGSIYAFRGGEPSLLVCFWNDGAWRLAEATSGCFGGWVSEGNVVDGRAVDFPIEAFEAADQVCTTGRLQAARDEVVFPRVDPELDEVRVFGAIPADVVRAVDLQESIEELLAAGRRAVNVCRPRIDFAPPPDLEPLLEELNGRRLAIIRASGEPLWLFPGFDTTGARDISGQPAMANSRQVGDRRMEVGEGILQVLRTDLMLRLGLQEYARLGADKLRLQWPEFFVDVNAQSQTQLNDDDEESSIPEADKHDDQPDDGEVVDDE